MGTLGYSNVKNRYAGVWIDSMGTHTLMSTESVDLAGKVKTMYFEATDPVSGKPVKQRMVTTLHRQGCVKDGDVYACCRQGSQAHRDS